MIVEISVFSVSGKMIAVTGQTVHRQVDCCMVCKSHDAQQTVVIDNANANDFIAALLK